MSYKNKKVVTIYDLGAIVEKLIALDNNGNDGELLRDSRIMLAELWLSCATKMQRLKALNCKTYRNYAVEEEMILSAIILFSEQCRNQRKPSLKRGK